MGSKRHSVLEHRVQNAFVHVESAIRAGQIPGGVLGAVTTTGENCILAAGSAQLVPDRRPMQAGTWFDLASLSKVIFTTPRILALHEKGSIDLDAPLISVLPDLRQYDANCWERKVTFRQCLAHQTPFPAVEPIYTYGRDAELLRAFVLQRQWNKGEPVYSDINFILLGFALERIHGMRLRDMDPGNGFAFSAEPGHCAATENCTWRGRVLCGEVHDDNCSALQGAGHAGLFAPATAVLEFARGLLDGSGFSTSIIELMRQSATPTRTLGWEHSHEGWSGGDACSDTSIGHTGFTGTGLWVDFDNQVAWTLLTNRIHPTRHHDSAIVALRKAVGNTLYAQ